MLFALFLLLTHRQCKKVLCCIVYIFYTVLVSLIIVLFTSNINSISVHTLMANKKYISLLNHSQKMQIASYSEYILMPGPLVHSQQGPLWCEFAVKLIFPFNPLSPTVLLCDFYLSVFFLFPRQLLTNLERWVAFLLSDDGAGIVWGN